MNEKQINQYLSFKLDNEHYALDVQSVREVLEYRDITHIPRMPSYMLGVINLRGQVVPVIDLRVKFHMAENEKTVNTSIIVVEMEKDGNLQSIGLLTDTVEAVSDVSSDQIQPPPQMGTKVDRNIISGMAQHEGQFLIILNLEELLQAEELELLQQKVNAS